MTIKKQFTEIITLLEANVDKRVRDILPEVKVLAAAKSAGSGGPRTFYANAEKEVLFIKCYYFKKWLSVKDTEGVEIFSKKASTASTYNTMCKIGNNHWTNQNSTSKKAKDKVLVDVSEGTLAPEKVKSMLEEIEAARIKVVKCPHQGYDTVEAACKANNIPYVAENTPVIV